MRYGSLSVADVEPAFGLFAFGDDASAVADQPIDQCYVRSIGAVLDVVRSRDIARHEDMRFDASSSGVGCQSAAGIARGRDGDFAKAQFHAHRHGARQAASFERAGRVGAFVLHPKVACAEARGQPVRLQQRRHAFAQRDDMFWIVDRKQRRIAPHGRGALRRASRDSMLLSPFRDRSGPEAGRRIRREFEPCRLRAAGRKRYIPDERRGT